MRRFQPIIALGALSSKLSFGICVVLFSLILPEYYRMGQIIEKRPRAVLLLCKAFAIPFCFSTDLSSQDALKDAVNRGAES